MNNVVPFPAGRSALALLAIENAYADEGALMGFGFALIVSCGIWIIGFGVAALIGA
jgi:hypothetical protein